MKMKPIGRVSSEIRSPGKMVFACERGREADNISRIIVSKKYMDGLAGLEKFSHLWVIYSLHLAKRVEMKTHPGPPSMKNLQRAGIFASRSQYRPNKIALRLAALQKIEGNVLTVRGLDAVDGTPVLDIKPYVPHFDEPESPVVAEWYQGWGVGKR